MDTTSSSGSLSPPVQLRSAGGGSASGAAAILAASNNPRSTWWGRLSKQGRVACACGSVLALIVFVAVPLALMSSGQDGGGFDVVGAPGSAPPPPPPSVPTTAPIPGQTTTTTTTLSPGQMLWNEVRLPHTIYPTAYRLDLTPDLDAFTYDGHVAIDITVTEPVSTIVLHGLGLTIGAGYKLLTAGGEDLAPHKIIYDEDLQFIYVTLWSPIPAGEYTLDLPFSGEISERLLGFYRSSYDVAGETRWMATTHFEPVAARRAFPCFDEPAMKATFTVSITAPSDRTVLNNMPLESATAVSATHSKFVFGTTPPMSSYLVCFIISDFEATPVALTADGIEVRVWTKPGETSKGVFARDVAVANLEHYTDIFGVPFPIPKMDLVAVPDFAAGAMENWALVTYRETAVLIDPAESSRGNYLRVATVVAHELAHQWFGDRTTMEWWNALWLNEGFASFVEYEGVNAVFPDWLLWDEFIYSDQERAMDLDALASTHRLDQPALTPEDIDELFDAISYSKGASVLKMLSAYMDAKGGPGTFFAGLNVYLEAHAFANAETVDLWQGLTSVAGEDITQLMDAWTREEGFPLVTLSYDDGAGVIRATQQRFLIGDAPPDSASPTWNIPFSYTTENAAGGAVTQARMDISGAALSIPYNHATDGWFKANVGQDSYYRVEYVGSLRTAAQDALLYSDPFTLSAKDRAGFVSDSFALAEAGHLTITDALTTVQYLENETSYVGFRVALGELGKLRSKLQFQACYGDFRRFVASLITPVTQRLLAGDDGGLSSHVATQFRSMLVYDGAIHYNQEDAVANATGAFAAWADGSVAALSPDDRSAAYCAGVKYDATGTAFDFLWDRFVATDFAAEKRRMLGCLAQTREPYLLQRLLDEALGPHVREQDVASLVVNVARNPSGAYLAWNYVQSEWDELCARFCTGTFAIDTLVSGVTSHFSTDHEREEVEAFFAAHEHGSSERTIEQSLEHISANKAWLDANLAEIETFLESYNS